MRKESEIPIPPDSKETRFFDIAGDKKKVRAKLQKRFTIAFLASDNFRISIASNNDHLAAAKTIGLPTNNSSRILCKGRINPALRVIVFHNSDLAQDSLYSQQMSQESIERMNSEVAKCLIAWLGEGFEDYKTQFRSKTLAA